MVMLSFAIFIHVGVLWRSCTPQAPITLAGGGQVVHLTIPGTKALSARAHPRMKRSKKVAASHQLPTTNPPVIAANQEYGDPLGSESQAPVGTASATIGDAEPTGPIDLGLGAAQGSLGTFESLILEQIRDHEYYPKSARLRRMEGDVMVEFTLQADGTLTELKIAGSSGHDLLDTTAKEIMIASSPFPAPSSYGLGERHYVLPMYFRVSQDLTE